MRVLDIFLRLSPPGIIIVMAICGIGYDIYAAKPKRPIYDRSCQCHYDDEGKGCNCGVGCRCPINSIPDPKPPGWHEGTAPFVPLTKAKAKPVPVEASDADLDKIYKRLHDLTQRVKSLEEDRDEILRAHKRLGKRATEYDIEQDLIFPSGS